MDRAEVVVIAGCPPAEELAEFLEGRLTGARRDAVVRHLADCDDCRAVYLSAAEFAQLEAEASETKAAPVVSIDSRRGGPGGTRFWSYAAAACLGVMLAGVAFRLSQPSGLVQSTEQLLDLAGKSAGWSDSCVSCRAFPVDRGDRDTDSGEVIAAFWAGRSWAETVALVRAENLRRASEAYAVFLDRIDSLAMIHQIKLDPSPPDKLPSSAEELNALEKQWLPAIRKLDPEGYWELDLGRWLTSAQRALERGNSDFFAANGKATMALHQLELSDLERRELEDLGSLSLTEIGDRLNRIEECYPPDGSDLPDHCSLEPP